MAGSPFQEIFRVAIDAVRGRIDAEDLPHGGLSDRYSPQDFVGEDTVVIVLGGYDLSCSRDKYALRETLGRIKGDRHP